MSNEVATDKPRTRPARPGMVRVMVSLTDAQHARIQKLAVEESPVFPREVNEWLSIWLNKNLDAQIAAATK